MSSGEYYLRARMYDPSTGRWTSEDPAQDGTNWYSYCYNNPISLVDPTGCIPTWAKWLIGGIVIAGLVAASIATGGAAAVIAGTALTQAGAITTMAATGAVFSGGLGALTASASAYIQGGDVADAAADGFMWGAISGGASGALGGTSLGIVGQMAANSAISAGTYLGSSYINDQLITPEGFLMSAGGGAIAGAVGGAGMFNAQTTYGSMLAMNNPAVYLYRKGGIHLGLNQVGVQALRRGLSGVAMGANVGTAITSAPAMADAIQSAAAQGQVPIADSPASALALGQGPIAYSAPPTTAASALALGRGPIAFTPSTPASSGVTVNRTNTNLNPAQGTKVTVYWSNGTRTSAVA